MTWVSSQSLALLLEYLQELGVVPAPPLAQGVFEELLAEYRRYLLVERQLSEHTVLDAYVPVARLFLEGWERPDGLGLERLSAADVSMFLARECPKRSASGARDLGCALRSFLRYLHLAGVIEVPLVWAVPSVADLRDRTLPRGLEPTAVRELLASCDRRTLVGRRDHAILLLLSRLGLRAGEVAAITLDDVDWGGGLLLVHGKGSRGGPAALAGRCRRGDRLVSSSPPAVRVPGVVSAGERAAWSGESQHDRLGCARGVRPGGPAASRCAPAAAHGGDRNASERSCMGCIIRRVV
ncbi:MAG: tyrosine-type recombinase/integrase [Pseudonocardiaceae bacterium]